MRAPYVNWRVLAVSLVVAGLAAWVVSPRALGQSDRSGGVISGMVRSSQGPEAGVWVIAETNDLPTRVVKIVVTDDQGRFLLPDLPRAAYEVWVRGYGLVDSRRTKASPGDTVTLEAVVAGTPAEAAKVYPANYWYALLEPPAPGEFPGTGPQGNGIAPTMRSQAQWIDNMKQGCQLCHQLGNQITRQVTHMQSFDSTVAAWDYRVQTGQRGNQMSSAMSRFGRQRGLRMYADWTDRIASGEVPQARPPRPQGVERNLVLTMWDWGVETSFIHDEITTDKRNPRVNAGGPVYAVSAGHGNIVVTDPVRHTSSEIPIPTRDDPATIPSRFPTELMQPSNFFGNTLLWTGVSDPHNPMMDGQGRLWMTSTVRDRPNPAWCKEGSANKFAQYYPLEQSARHASYYDPKTGRFALIETCFGTHHLFFGEDENDTLYFSGGGAVIPWINTKLYDRTGDAESSQGWCPTVLDTSGDGRITKPWNEPVGGGRSTEEGAGGGRNESVDPTRDTRVNIGSYGVIASPADHSVWAASTSFPGRIVRLDRGSNPPETCIAEMYEVPEVDGDYPGFGPRGIDVDRNGVIWSALSGSSHLASFDRRKCKVFGGPAMLTGQQCKEGWTLYRIPGPNLRGTDVRADFHYYNWVDQFNTLGLGENVPMATGSGSDSLIALLPSTGEWVTLRVPYPLGFYTRGLDGRIDDPNAGWKGRGLWATYGSNFIWHTEGGKGTRSKMVHFQLRPDPLAR